MLATTGIIRVRSEEDLKEMWGEIKHSSLTASWCEAWLMMQWRIQGGFVGFERTPIYADSFD